MRRRAALASGSLALTSVLAGCLESIRRPDAWRELVVDPPERVYRPPKSDEMVSYGSTTVDGRDLSLAATRPHSFWVVTDTERSRADVRSRHTFHLMGTVRDAETGAVVPAAATSSIRSRDGAGGPSTNARSGRCSPSV